MDEHLLAGTALGRLLAAELLPAVRGVRSVARDGFTVLVVDIQSDASDETREAVAEAIGDIPFEWNDMLNARGRVEGLTGFKDGRSWRLGTQDDVAWIENQTDAGLTITSAIPPVFGAYATIVIPDGDDAALAHEDALVRILATASGDQSWWLGYLERGSSSDLVFDHAPMIGLYANWHYVLVEAGPREAASWRANDFWRERLPELIYPVDRSWLLSTLWDDDWRCLGGSEELIAAVLAEPALDARSVNTTQDATPPGHTSI